MATEKAIVIPVKANLSYESVKEIGSALTKMTTDVNSKITLDQKQQATKLLDLVNQTSKEYQKAVSSDKVTKKQLQIFQKLFADIKDEARTLGLSIDKYLTGLGEDILSPDAKKQLIELKKLAETAATKAESVKAPEKVKFKALVGEDTAKELRMGKFANLGNALKDLQDTNKEYVELSNNQKNNIEIDEKRLDYLEKTKTLREDITKKVENQFNKEKDQQRAFDEAQKNALNAKKLYEETLQSLIDKAQGPAKEALQVLLDESKKLGENLKDIKIQDLFKDLTEKVNPVKGLVEGLKNNFTQFIGSIASGALIISTLKRIFNDTIKTIKELDRAFNDIAMVTTYTTQEVWKMKDSFVGIAQTTGLTVVEVTKIAGEFFRQGRSMSEVMKLTEAAGIAAKVAGISAGDSVKYLTSAVNGYKLSADQAMMVSDKFAALAASSATDYEELAVALSKVAAQAYSAGVNMDNLMGFIAKALEATREAPENIGTAFKTIFARMQELKDYGKTLEDGMDVNRVDKALKVIGVSLTDQENELRNLDDVLIDVGYKWKDLTKNQKAYVATALAGTRQQTRLLAVFEDFDRTMELANVSADSLGATFAQQEKYYNSIAYAQNNLTIAWQNFLSSLGSSTVFVAFYDTLAGLVTVLNNVLLVFKDVGGVLLIGTAILVAITLAQKAHNQSIKDMAKALMIALGLKKEEIAKTIASIGLKTTEAFSWEVLAAKILEAAGAMLTWLATNPVGWAVLATVAIIGMAAAIQSSINKVKNFTENMKKSQAEIFNLRKKSSDLQGFLDQYTKLQNKTERTAADVQKTNELIRQMQDILGSDVNILTLEGDLDLDIIRQQIKTFEEEADEKFKDSITTTLDTWKTLEKAYMNTIDSTVKEQIKIQYLIENSYIDSYSAFLKLEKDKRQQLKDTAALQLELAKTKEVITSYGGTFSDTYGIHTFTPEEAKAEIARLTKYYNEQGMSLEQAAIKAQEYAKQMGIITVKVEVVLDEKQAQKATEAFNKLVSEKFSKMNLTQQTQYYRDNILSLNDPEIQNALKNLVPELSSVESIINLMGLSAEDAAIKLERITKGDDQGKANFNSRTIYDLANAVKQLNIPLEQQSDLFNKILDNGENYFVAINEYVEKYNLTTFEAISLTEKLMSLIDNSSLENIASDVTTLNSVYSNMDKLNNMLAGKEDYDILFIQDMINTYGEAYPQLADLIKNHQQISLDAIKTIANAQKQAVLDEIKRNIEIKKAEKTTYDDKIKNLETWLALVESGEINLSDWKIDLNKTELGTLYNQYIDYLIEKNQADALFTDEAVKAQLTSLTNAYKAGSLPLAAYTAAVRSLIETSSPLTGILGSLKVTVDGTSTSYGTLAERIKGEIAIATKARDDLDKQIKGLESLQSIIESTGNALAKTSEEAENLAEALTKIAILQEALDGIASSLSLLQDTFENLSGTEAIQNQNAQLAVMQSQLSGTLQLIEAYTEANNNYLSGLEKATEYAGTYNIINGKLIINLDKFNQLTPEQQANLKDVADAFNDNADSISNLSGEYQNILSDIQDIRDAQTQMVIDTKELVIDALRQQLDAEDKIAEDSYNIQKEYLDKRRKLYEDAFSEEDYTNQLQETSDKRQSIIDKLAALEGATDLASNKKREELLQQKADLDKEYNQTVRDYSRDALEESIDDKETELDKQREAQEEALETAKNNVVELEKQAEALIQAGSDAVVSFLEQYNEEYISSTKEAKAMLINEWKDYADQTKAILTGVGVGSNAGVVAGAEDAVGAATAPPPAGDATPPPWEPKLGDKVRATKTGKGSSYGTGTTAKSTNTGYITDIKVGRANPYLMSDKASGGKPLGWYTKDALAKFQKGGLLNFTGPAWVDGSPNRPERVLSPVQTELFDKMVNSLQNLQVKSSLDLAGAGNISIGQISISTPQLNNKQDFAAAGKTLAAAFNEAISTRGLAINKKR